MQFTAKRRPACNRVAAPGDQLRRARNRRSAAAGTKPQVRRCSLLSRKPPRTEEIGMERAMYFRRQAEVLLGLARATIDLGVARRLRSLAAEFQNKADEFDGDDADFSPMPSAGRGSSSDNRR